MQSNFVKPLLHNVFREVGGDIDRYIDRYIDRDIEQDIDRYITCPLCTPLEGGHLEQAAP